MIVHTLVVLKMLGYSIVFNIILAFFSFVIVSRLLSQWFSHKKLQQERSHNNNNGFTTSTTVLPKRWKQEIFYSIMSALCGSSFYVLNQYLRSIGVYKLLDDDLQEMESFDTVARAVYARAASSNTLAYPLRGYRLIILIVSQFLVYFIAFDLYYYLLHRFVLHSKRLLWKVHKIHHDSFTPNIMTGFSFHPVEAILTGYFPHLMAIALCDMHSITMVCISLYGLVNTIAVHLGYELFPRSFFESRLTNWYLTTIYHDLHHSKIRYNFGGFTTIWDRCFGTEYPNYQSELNKRFATNIPNAK